jgi:hypothetical protein
VSAEIVGDRQAKRLAGEFLRGGDVERLGGGI